MAAEPLPELKIENTRILRTFLGLIVASSILQCALVLGIYYFRLTGWLPWLLVVIGIAPACVMVFLAVRKRAAETEPYFRTFYTGVSIVATFLIAITALLAVFTSNFVNSLSFAAVTFLFPAGMGILPALVLLLPKRMLKGSFSDVLLPVRLKVKMPYLRRIFRMLAVYLAYLAVDFLAKCFDASFGILAYFIALLPVLPIFGMIWVYRRYLAEEQDEFQRHLFHQSILWALLGTLVIASAIGRLQTHAHVSLRALGLFQTSSIFPLFWWLQFESVFIVDAVQAVRMVAQEKQEKKLR